MINDQRQPNFYLTHSSDLTLPEVPSNMVAQFPYDLARHSWVTTSSQPQIPQSSSIVIDGESLGPQKSSGTHFIGSQFYPPPFPETSMAPNVRSFGPSAGNHRGSTPQINSSSVPRTLDASSSSTHAIIEIQHFSPTQFLTLCKGLLSLVPLDTCTHNLPWR